MGLQPLSPAPTREVAPELRSLTEAVWRLLSRDGGPAALRMVSRAILDLEQSGHSAALPPLTAVTPGGDAHAFRALAAAGVSRRAYLLNLRGIVQAQQRCEDSAAIDLRDATLEAPGWYIPWYNLGLFHKYARRWQQAHDAFLQALSCTPRGRDPGKALLWNLGMVQTALGHYNEARATWQRCGLPVPAGPSHCPPDIDLGLAQLSLPTKGTYAAERVWVQRLDPTRARILSVVRYGAPCQFGDVVFCGSGEGHTGYWDGLLSAATSESGDALGATLRSREPSQSGMVFLDVLETAGYVLHVVRGAPASAAQATQLTERLREAELHIEVWSLTMRLPDDNRAEGAAVPLCAGMVIPYDWQDPRRSAERAVTELSAVERELGLLLLAPTLMEAAGDELGAARHRKQLRLHRL